MNFVYYYNILLESVILALFFAIVFTILYFKYITPSETKGIIKQVIYGLSFYNPINIINKNENYYTFKQQLIDDNSKKQREVDKFNQKYISKIYYLFISMFVPLLVILLLIPMLGYIRWKDVHITEAIIYSSITMVLLVIFEVSFVEGVILKYPMVHFGNIILKILNKIQSSS